MNNSTIPIGGCGGEEYYQTTAISVLLKVLSDITMASSHYHVVGCIMAIFSNQGVKSVVFLPQVGLLAPDSRVCR